MSRLYIIPTPIGNLDDITYRAIQTLRAVDLILCEDTRTSSKFLNHFDISKPLKSYHIHNEHKIVDHLIEQLSEGRLMALISDAGTPSISDPGFLLIRSCIKKGIEVDCLPGATAFVPALVNSGLPSNQFLFEGFLPTKKGRQTRLKSLKSETKTMIFYESPHRLMRTLEDFTEIFGKERYISVSRELSKIHEETIRGSISEVQEHYKAYPPKGEIVIIVNGFA